MEDSKRKFLRLENPVVNLKGFQDFLHIPFLRSTAEKVSKDNDDNNNLLRFA